MSGTQTYDWLQQSFSPEKRSILDLSLRERLASDVTCRECCTYDIFSIKEIYQYQDDTKYTQPLQQLRIFDGHRDICIFHHLTKDYLHQRPTSLYLLVPPNSTMTT
jgi:hypothetical protein